MNTKIWLIIRDDRKKTFEVIGQATNDNSFTNRTYAMQRAGMNVSAMTPPVTNKTSSKELIRIVGYSPEPGLHERLQDELRSISRSNEDEWLNESEI